MGQSGRSNDRHRSPSIHLVRSAETTVLPRIICYLRDRHPVWTAKRIAAETGISAATITKWLTRGSAPSAAHLGVLAMVYRLDFLAAVFVEVGELELAARQERLRRLERQTAEARRAAGGCA